MSFASIHDVCKDSSLKSFEIRGGDEAALCDSSHMACSLGTKYTRNNVLWVTVTSWLDILRQL